MPRHIEFNNDAVLKSAMHRFRQFGYAGTSIKALEKTTGLSSGSLYNSFGGKDAIFVKALDHYNQTVVKQRIATHLGKQGVREALLSLFLSLLQEPGGGTHGCLLTNSAVEFGPGDSIARAGVAAGLALFETAFNDAVKRLLIEQGGQPGPALAKDHRFTASRLLALYQGVLVLHRFGHNKKQMAPFIRHQIDQITGVSL